MVGSPKALFYLLKSVMYEHKLAAGKARFFSLNSHKVAFNRGFKRGFKSGLSLKHILESFHELKVAAAMAVIGFDKRVNAYDFGGLAENIYFDSFFVHK